MPSEFQQLLTDKDQTLYSLDLARQETAQHSRDHKSYCGEVKRLTGEIERLREQLQNLKRAPVSSLRAWASAKERLSQAIEARLQCQLNAQVSARECKAAAESVRSLGARLKEIERDLSRYGHVVELRAS